MWLEFIRVFKAFGCLRPLPPCRATTFLVGLSRSRLRLFPLSTLVFGLFSLRRHAFSPTY